MGRLAATAPVTDLLVAHGPLLPLRAHPVPSPAATTQFLVPDAGEAAGGQRRGRVDGSTGIRERFHQGPDPGPLGLMVAVGVAGGVTVPKGRGSGR